MKRLLCILLCFVFYTNVIGALSCSRERFNEKVNVSSICKSEVSNFKENQYLPINNEMFLDAIKSSKRTYAKFIPHKQVVLYDKNGKTYMLFFSEDNRVFHSIAGDFKLSKRNALIVSKLFTDLDLQ